MIYIAAFITAAIVLGIPDPVSSDAERLCKPSVIALSEHAAIELQADLLAWSLTQRRYVYPEHVLVNCVNVNLRGLG